MSSSPKSLPNKMEQEHSPSSFASLLAAHKALSEHSSSVSEKNEPILRNALRALVECIIWGDKNDDDFFDFFCEHAMLELLYKVLAASRIRTLHMQVPDDHLVSGRAIAEAKQHSCPVEGRGDRTARREKAPPPQDA